MGEEFRLSALKRDFSSNNTQNTPNTISAHIALMTTNLRSRLSHKPKVDGSDDLLYRVIPGVYRRYDPQIDPSPIMPERSLDTNWASKLLVLNASYDYERVRSSRCFFLPWHQGYTITRTAYAGLYSNDPSKGIRGISNLVARVVVEAEGSNPEITWNNDEEVPAETLSTLVSEQATLQWDGPYPIQVLVMGEVHGLEFLKDTPGKMVRSNLALDISNLDHVSSEQLAEHFDSSCWSDHPDLFP
jgi:hypothetical protein